MLEFPGVLEVGIRVEVEYADTHGAQEFRHGTILVADVDEDAPDDPSYYVALDAPLPTVEGWDGTPEHPNTPMHRWFAWEWVRRLTLLELLAEASK